jgi:hypothetical protein
MAIAGFSLEADVSDLSQVRANANRTRLYDPRVRMLVLCRLTH